MLKQTGCSVSGRKRCRCDDRRDVTVLHGLVGKPGIIESAENQTDIYKKS